MVWFVIPFTNTHLRNWICKDAQASMWQKGKTVKLVLGGVFIPLIREDKQWLSGTNLTAVYLCTSVKTIDGNSATGDAFLQNRKLLQNYSKDESEEPEKGAFATFCVALSASPNALSASGPVLLLYLGNRASYSIDHCCRTKITAAGQLPGPKRQGHGSWFPLESRTKLVSIIFIILSPSFNFEAIPERFRKPSSYNHACKRAHCVCFDSAPEPGFSTAALVKLGTGKFFDVCIWRFLLIVGCLASPMISTH